MAINPDVGIDTSQYADFGAFFGPAWNRYTELQKQSNAYDPTKAATDLQSYGNTFRQQFENLVGRAPNDNELQSFYSTVVAPQGSFPGGGYAGAQELSDRTKSFISDNFQRAAEEQALNELNAQQSKANDLSNLFRSQGNTAINNYEKSILDFTQSLVERTRPQLYTRMQAMGLLNTGGLNEAIAGQQADLARDAGQQVADLRLQNEQGANEIAFSGAAAPFELQRALAQNRVANVQGAGQSALERMFNTRNQELNYNYQLGLQNNAGRLQRSMQPSFLRTLGQSTAQSMGNSFGQWVAPNAGASKEGSGGNYAQVASLLSSRKAKKNIKQLTEAEEDDLYDRMVNMPLNRWHYKTEDDNRTRHLGVMTQEAVPEVVMEDGIHLNVVDYIGALTLALKVQDRRYKKLVGGK
jgi:hypothetical protein